MDELIVKAREKWEAENHKEISDNPNYTMPKPLIRLKVFFNYLYLLI